MNQQDRKEFEIVHLKIDGLKKDIEKMRQQYGNVTFDYVVVAELNDWDVGPDDVYYKKINLGDAHVQATLNKYIKSDRIN